MDEKSNVMEDNEEVKETDLVPEESFADDLSDEDEEAEPDEGEVSLEAPLTEEEIQDLIDELLQVETKAAEAQEALEEEALKEVEEDVRAELAEKLQGDELERAVEDEMETLREEWEIRLDELETESAHLLEQLDGAGVDLPSIYKWIESQVPNGCRTESWKKRTHWVGSEVTNDAMESIRDAEKHLQMLRPVRRRHGKVLEEGASGFLGKKVTANDTGESLTEKSEVDWSSFNKIFSQQSSKEGIAFGSEKWASVYLASTPKQAAALGLEFPGVNEVEEIDDIDDNSSDPFIADALENEKELLLSEEQRKNYRKVKEEDDISVDKKLQLRLKRRRRRRKQGVIPKALESESGDRAGDHQSDDSIAKEPASAYPHDAIKENICNGDSSKAAQIVGLKRLRDEDKTPLDSKRSRVDIVDCDGKTEALPNNNDFTGDDDFVTGYEYLNTDAAPYNAYENFHCTACGKIVNDIHQHPFMNVIVCGGCKRAVEAKMLIKDSDLSEFYCGWCGRSDDLIDCRSCKRLFCKLCIKRNIGVEYSSKAKVYGWQCCCCSPVLLKPLTLELEKALGSSDSSSSSCDTESDSDGVATDDVGITISPKTTSNKKIRRILDDTELGEETKRKIAMEKERQERLKSLKAQFSGISMINMSNISGSLPEGATSEVLGDVATGFIVNVARERGEEAVRIPPSISAKLKTHQVAGIRFMWENIIQSIRNVKSGDKGLGCILAHTMGLGKTLQVIAFLYTAMRSVDLGLKTALVVAPVNVLHNWRQEFRKWEPKELKPLRVYMLEDKPREKRAELLKKWITKGGVFLIGYTAFRNLSLGKHIKDRQVAKEICHSLQEGCDILVCDEAHMIKNTRADTTQALKQVKCQRRIALTGSPLQNNLMEYYCMVDFVREGFLGSMHEFRNRFQNPIENGQHANSTAEDVRIMNQRSHILYEQLKGFVQRMDMSVVKNDLPPKTVFVISVKLSSLQRKLYKRFLDVHGFTSNRVSGEGLRRKSFFAGYQALAQICNHPWILQLLKERGYARRQDPVENFLPDGSSSDENTDSNVGIADKTKSKMESTPVKDSSSFLHEGWWNDLLNPRTHHEIGYSGKMVLLLDILTRCSEIGDKALVFSQSIPALDLIESYLSELTRPGKNGKWKRGKDWYRIDGKTEGSERQKLVDAFNHPHNRRVKCTLISTRAGALGINLFAANRVIIVDGSWNPTYDLQAIYRAWRYGQKKPVYAYRLVAHGTVEEKIYKRQVKKEGLAARVVDRQQVHRSMSKEEILHLFEFSGDENIDILLGRTSPDCPETCSSDKLMGLLLDRHRVRWITNYHEHETLLQENEEEKLTKEEQDLAWEVYRRSMEWHEVHRIPADESTFDKPKNPNASSSVQATSGVAELALNIRIPVPGRKCTKVSHMLTLKSQGIKLGCSTICGECAHEISW